MAYIPNADDATQPVGSVDPSTAAAEFRAVKAKLNLIPAVSVVINPLDINTEISLSAGDLIATKNAGLNSVSGRGTAGKITGNWYFETTVIVQTGLAAVGIAKLLSTLGTILGSDANAYAYRSDGAVTHNSATLTTVATYTSGDIIGAAYNLSANTLAFYKNGTLVYTVTGLSAGGFSWYPAFSLTAIADQLLFNFGASAFTYSVSGFVGLVGYRTIAYTGRQNMLVNGNFESDQLNAYSALAPVTAGAYVADCWQYFSTQAGKYNAQTVLNDGSAPSGYQNYLKVTVASSFVCGSTDIFIFQQGIEGLRTKGLGWANPGIQDQNNATLLFFCKAAVTGTYSGVVSNYAGTYLFPFSFTITTANVWQRFAIQIPPAPIAAAVPETAAGSLYVKFCLGAGGNYLTATAGWQAGSSVGVTGTVQLVSQPNGTTYEVTGVEFRRGSWAVDTPYEILDGGDNLRDCQRYYQTYLIISSSYAGGGGIYTNVMTVLPVPMRAAPTVTFTGTADTNLGALSSSPSAIAVNVYANSTAAGQTIIQTTVQANARI